MKNRPCSSEIALLCALVVGWGGRENESISMESIEQAFASGVVQEGKYRGLLSESFLPQSKFTDDRVFLEQLLGTNDTGTLVSLPLHGNRDLLKFYLS